jgi:hypothetical protein
MAIALELFLLSKEALCTIFCNIFIGHNFLFAMAVEFVLYPWGTTMFAVLV